MIQLLITILLVIVLAPKNASGEEFNNTLFVIPDGLDYSGSNTIPPKRVIPNTKTVPSLSGKLSPSTYGVDEYWGQIVDFEQDVFFGSDIGQEARAGFSSTLNFVIDFYGNYGPTEWWIVGNDQSAIDQLASLYADRRQERNQLDEYDGVGDYEITLSNIKEGFGGYAGVTNAGLNGSREDGYHLLMVSEGILTGGGGQPTSLVVENPNLSMDTVAHEYTHLVQSALLFNKESFCEPDNCYRVGWGPTFFAEGSAVYYGEYIPRKLLYDGGNIVWQNLQEGLKSRMQNIMNQIQSSLVNCPNFDVNEIDYSTRDSCSPYEFGAWGTAYLLNKVGDQDAMWKSFWPNIDQLGWDQAFEATFGLSLEQFNQEFLDFLELPIEEQLEIIPELKPSDTDLDGLINNFDPDDDNDGVLDSDDAFPLDENETVDTDSDGLGNNADTDDDNDAVLDADDAFPLDSAESADTDKDGVGDNSDVFPFDASESIDTDGDGFGNTADLDDDNDGYSDEQEAIDGTDPLNPFSCSQGCFSFDIDLDEKLEADALTDGLLVIRHLFGFSGDSLIADATSNVATRQEAEEITSYLNDAESELDIDGDGEAGALTDGLLLIRYLFGFSGDALISGAVSENAQRTTAEQIQAYISERIPVI